MPKALNKITKIRGFWNDPDGLSLGELVTLFVLPVWIYVAIKFAVLEDVTTTQIDYFLILSYPLLIAVGGRALEEIIPFNKLGNIMNRKNNKEGENYEL
ncbi:MAG: hypothetical protein ACOYJ1_16490 [Peptococcales bacterium]|jgi:uncharacterized membrane protein YjdF